MPLVERHTVNSEWYTTICLPEVFEEKSKTNQRRLVILHHMTMRALTHLLKQVAF